MAERSSHDRRVGTRAFRALLGLYPAQFRDEYGRELALVFADRYRDATTPWARGSDMDGALCGVLTEAPKEHLHMLRQDLRYALRPFVRSPLFAAHRRRDARAWHRREHRGLPVDRRRRACAACRSTSPHELAEVRIAGGNKGFGLNPGRYAQLTRPIWQELEAHQQAFSGTLRLGGGRACASARTTTCGAPARSVGERRVLRRAGRRPLARTPARAGRRGVDLPEPERGREPCATGSARWADASSGRTSACGSTASRLADRRRHAAAGSPAWPSARASTWRCRSAGRRAAAARSLRRGGDGPAAAGLDARARDRRISTR